MVIKKLKELLLILIWFAAFSIQAKAFHTNHVEIDTTRKPENYSALLSGSIGIANTYSLEDNFTDAPAFGIGVEIPFDAYHLIGFEILTHTWIAEYTGSGNPTYYAYEKAFEDHYYQLGWTAGFKGYTAGNDVFCRMSYHLGYAFSPDNDYYALDFGVGLSFNISENYYLSLDARAMFPLQSYAMNFFTNVPDMLFLNLSRQI